MRRSSRSAARFALVRLCSRTRRSKNVGTRWQGDRSQGREQRNRRGDGKTSCGTRSCGDAWCAPPRQARRLAAEIGRDGGKAEAMAVDVAKRADLAAFVGRTK